MSSTAALAGACSTPCGHTVSIWSAANARTPGNRRGLSATSNVDVGDIAVVQDEGDLILPPNTYDLRSLGLRFTRNSSGGYDVARIDGNFRATLGTRLTLTDDDSATSTVPFGFSFYGKGQTAAFVNSDGNITFEEADHAEHRSQRRTPADRAAACRAVSGRSRSDARATAGCFSMLRRITTR